MGFAIIYNKEIQSEWISSSRRIVDLKGCEIHSDINPDEYILRVHSHEYYSKVRATPFFRPAYESLKCILASADEVEKHEMVIVPTSATGHQAERDRWRGYSFFNDLAILVERLKDKGYRNISIIETDAHHSDTYKFCSAKLFCISGTKKCRVIEEMRCRVSREADKDDYLKRFHEIVRTVKAEDPEIVIWYLGQDLHEMEYAEGCLDSESFRKMIENFMTIPARKIVILASGSRDDVFNELISAFREHL